MNEQEEREQDDRERAMWLAWAPAEGEGISEERLAMLAALEAENARRREERARLAPSAEWIAE